MSERVGSVRDARFLSGADLGRRITFRDRRTGRRKTVTIRGVEHGPGGVTIYYWRYRRAWLSRNDAVTITGADGSQGD